MPENRCTGVLAKIKSDEIKGDDLIRSIIIIAQVAEEAMGGTSGALYSYEFSLNKHVSKKTSHTF